MSDSDRQPPEGSEPSPKIRPPRRDRDTDDLPRPSPWGPVILIGCLLAVMLAWSWKSFGGSGTEVDYNFFWKQLEENNIAEVTSTGLQITGKWKKIPESGDPAKKLTLNRGTLLGNW